MTSTDLARIRTTALRIGQSFPDDLIDSSGIVLLVAGEQVTPALIRELISRGCHTVYLKSPSSPVSSYRADHLRVLEGAVAEAAGLLVESVRRMRQGQQIAAGEFDAPLMEMQRVLQEDPCAVVDRAMNASQHREHPIAIRSVRLAMLTQVTASAIGIDPPTCRLASRAALLSDISLLRTDDAQSLWEELCNGQVSPEIAMRYHAHPDESACLVETLVSGSHRLESLVIRQSHEHCDGSGFPRGIATPIVHRLSRIVNLIDVFLMLTEAQPDGRRLAPADVLAYLILHSLYGVFDLEAVRALVRATAVYPVGTEVLLNDRRRARVVRSVGRQYLDPIVRVDETGEELNLHIAPLEIVAPATSPDTVRLSKRRLDERLWDISVQAG